MRTGQWRDMVSVLGAKYNLGARGLLPPSPFRREKMLMMHMGIPGALRCCDNQSLAPTTTDNTYAGEGEI